MTAREPPPPADLVSEVDSMIRAAATPGRAEHEKQYLKSELEHRGTAIPELRNITKTLVRESVPNERDATLKLAEELWRHPVHELRVVASLLLAERQDLLGSHDIPLLERLLRQSRTWALVDVLAPWVVGPIVERDRDEHATLERWSKDPDLWLRRASLLTYMIPLRKGLPVFDRFTAIADPLLEDEEFFVRKAIGWMLRERAKTRPDEVFEWLLPRKDRASRLTLREASKHLGEQRIAELLGRGA